NHSSEAIEGVGPEEALNHPNWSMGRKITIDSATLMNKGLEVIEARWLFDMPLEQIAVYVHPQSIVHSMVEYIDGSILAQMASPDMRGPIAYALSYPQRLKLNTSPLDLCSMQGLTFFEPDLDRFPSLRLAYEAIRAGKTMPVVLSSADEIAVDAFLEKRITFRDIPQVIEETMSSHTLSEGSSVEEIIEVDKWARARAGEIIEKRITV
ncbi:MAG: 1-deoxy-D-xylulose-5-phosphate reductoisomerase, partial [Thermodesulfobacteriota bacterium]